MSRNFVVKCARHNHVSVAAFFNENFMKIKLHHIKVCKKKNLLCVYYVCPTGHSLASLGEPGDAKVTLRTDLSIYT